MDKATYLGIRAKFVERFPLVFVAKGSGTPKFPLAIGIVVPLIAACPDIAPEPLKQFLRRYTTGRRYWGAMLEGATRLDPTGLPNGVVSRDQARFAARKLRGVKKRPKSATAPVEIAA